MKLRTIKGNYVFTTAEDAADIKEITGTIESLYRTHTSAQIAQMLGVSHDAVRARLSYYGLRSPRRAAALREASDRRDILRSLWRRGTPREIADYMGLTARKVHRDARHLGLTACHGREQTQIPA